MLRYLSKTLSMSIRYCNQLAESNRRNLFTMLFLPAIFANRANKFFVEQSLFVPWWKTTMFTR